MPQDYAEDLAAVAVVGRDMMQGHRMERTPYMRNLVKIALTGSAAAADAEIEVNIGDLYVGRVPNNRTGTVVLDEADWKVIGRMIRPNEKLMARVTDAASTNPLRFHFVTVP